MALQSTVMVFLIDLQVRGEGCERVVKQPFRSRMYMLVVVKEIG